jgi:hypothetical protein
MLEKRSEERSQGGRKKVDSRSLVTSTGYRFSVTVIVLSSTQADRVVTSLTVSLLLVLLLLLLLLLSSSLATSSNHHHQKQTNPWALKMQIFKTKWLLWYSAHIHPKNAHGDGGIQPKRQKYTLNLEFFGVGSPLQAFRSSPCWGLNPVWRRANASL